MLNRLSVNSSYFKVGGQNAGNIPNPSAPTQAADNLVKDRRENFDDILFSFFCFDLYWIIKVTLLISIGRDN